MANRPLVVKIVGDADFKEATKKLSGFSKSIGSVFQGVGVGLGVGLANQLSSGFGEALNLEAANDKLQAQLGLTAEKAKELGEVSSKVYANAWGENIEEVNSVVQSVFASFPDTPPDVIQATTEDALAMADAFEGSADQYVTLAAQLTNQGIVESVGSGLDFITASFQQLPSEMRDPLAEAVGEYGTFMDSLGFSTEQTFSILTDAAREGGIGLDKTADALKEFSILATDMSKASTEAFSTIGLDAQTMAEGILAGGEQAGQAFDQIVDGLLDIENPVEQANTAIALFGSPIEDLNVTQIPEFLESLDATGKSFEDVAGVAREMGDTLGDNLATRIEGLRRGAMLKLTQFLSNVVIPVVDKVIDVWQNNFAPVISTVTGIITEGVDAFRTAFSFLTGDAEQADSYFENIMSGGIVGFFSEVAVLANNAINTFQGFASKVRSIFGGGGGGGGPFSSVKAAIDTLADALRPAVGFINDFIVVLGNGFDEKGSELNSTAQNLALTVRNLAGVLINDVIPAVQAFISEAVRIAQELWPRVQPVLEQIVDLFTATFELVVVVVRRAIDIIGFIWSTWGDEIVDVVMVAFGLISGIITNALDIITGIVRVISGVLRGDWSEAWEGIKQIVDGAFGLILTIIRAGWGLIRTLFSAGISLLREAWSRLWGRLKQFASDRFDSIKTDITDTIADIVSAFKAMPGKIKRAVSGLFDSLWDNFRTPINRIIDGWNGLSFSLPGFDAGPFGSFDGITIGTPNLPRLATGNVATRPTLAIFGEYAGARHNPEITTPESTMADTFRRVLNEQGGRNQPAIQIGQVVTPPGRHLDEELDLLVRKYLPA